MADIADEQQSEVVRITGGEEQFIVDVILKPDGSKRLAVDSETAISTDLEIVQQIDINEPLDQVTYYDIYSELGVVTVSGFALEFDNRNVFVRLQLDGQTIFDLNVAKLRDLLDWNQASLPPFYVSWNDNLKAFYFTPNFPIKSSSSVVISARSGQGNRTYVGGIIQVG